MVQKGRLLQRRNRYPVRRLTVESTLLPPLQMNPKSIVFVHPLLLHYHYPRLQALSAACSGAGIAFSNITLATYMEAYRTLVSGACNSFHNVTLFSDRTLENTASAEMWRALSGELERLRPEVLFLYGYSLAVLRRAKSWADKRQTATVLISDSNGCDRRRFRLFELMKSLLVSRYDAAFVGGTNSSRYLEGLGLPRNRIATGYDVVDNDYYSSTVSEKRNLAGQIRAARNLPEDYFLFVGRLIAEKNLICLLDAYSDYAARVAGRSPPWELVLCGEGPEQELLRGHAGRLPGHLSNRIRFCGLITQADLVDFYACARALVLPSISESWGLVVNEAMACSLPVIVSSRCGCSLDLVQEGVNGYLFDPEKRSELASAMSRLHLMGTEERADIGRRGKEIVEEWGLQKFSRNALACAALACRHREGRRAQRMRM